MTRAASLLVALSLLVGPGGCTSSSSEPEVDRATRVVPHLVGAAAIDPSGSWVAFVRDQDVWIRPLAGDGSEIDVTGVAERNPFAEPAAQAEPARTAQAGWEYDPAWSPDGRAMLIVAARDDGDDDHGNDRDLDVWLLDFGDLDWQRLAADDRRLSGPDAVDQRGENGGFWDDCPAPPESAEESAAELETRLASCVRRLRPPTYHQVTNDDGVETDPRWVPGHGVVFRSEKGGLWSTELPASYSGSR